MKEEKKEEGESIFILVPVLIFLVSGLLAGVASFFLPRSLYMEEYMTTALLGVIIIVAAGLFFALFSGSYFFWCALSTIILLVLNHVLTMMFLESLGYILLMIIAAFAIFVPGAIWVYSDEEI